MLHEVEPLIVHSENEQADRPTQSLPINTFPHNELSFLWKPVQEYTKERPVIWQFFLLAICMQGNCSTPYAVCGTDVVTEQLHRAITTD